jgi:YggT family protein
MSDSLVTIISYLFNALTLLIIARALLSWIDPGMRSSVGKILVDITEPLIGPIRRMMPSAGGIYFSPIVAIILLQFVERIVLQALA